MSKTYIHIPANGEPVAVTVEPGADELTTLQKLVGGYIEVVSNPDRGIELVINEEGKLLNLPANPKAYEFVWRRIGFFDFIVGDAVLVGTADEDGNFTSVPTDLASQLVPEGAPRG